MLGSGPGRSVHDPFTGMLMAMRDAWLAGIGFRNNFSAGRNFGAAAPGPNLLTPMIGALGAMADWAAASLQQLEQPGVSTPGGAAPDSDLNPTIADLAQPMSQAMMIAANRSVSYWLGLLQLFESHQAKLAQVVGGAGSGDGASESERLVAADELRTLLREVGDLAVREARILQNELSGLDESLAQTLQQADAPESYRRRWRTKL